jgi:hypothetical protein
MFYCVSASEMELLLNADEIYYSVEHRCVLIWRIPICYNRGRRVGQGVGGGGEERFFNHSG